MPGIRVPDGCKFAINWKTHNDVTISQHDVIGKIWRLHVSLVNFSYWSQVHVNIINGSGIMTILVYKELTRSLEIGNTPVWVLPNIWRLNRVKDAKFGTHCSNKKLWNAAKCQAYSFYRFWVITEKATVGVKLPSPLLFKGFPAFYESG